MMQDSSEVTQMQIMSSTMRDRAFESILHTAHRTSDCGMTPRQSCRDFPLFVREHSGSKLNDKSPYEWSISKLPPHFHTIRLLASGF